MTEFELGEIVYSVAGRDSGRYFAVVEIVDGNFVKIADGVLRKIGAPKLKKVKHLRSQKEICSKIAVKLAEGQKIFDSELAGALRAYNASL